MKDVIQNISLIVTIIGAVIGTITTIRKFLFKKSKKKERDYYSNVLVPLIYKISKDKGIEIRKKLKKYLKIKYEYIPKYLLYMLKKQEQYTEEDIKKILMVDYWELYENEDNSYNNTLHAIQKILEYVMFWCAIVLLGLGAFILVCALIGILSNINSFIFEETLILQNKEIILFILLGVIYIILAYAVFKATKNMSDDRYTIRVKKIEKMIENKKMHYDKNKENFYV